MGNWFSNLSVRNNGRITLDDVAETIGKAAASWGWSATSSEQEADVSLAVVPDEKGRWFSVYSDAFAFDDPKAFSAIATPLSAELHADILGICCFDSDYLYLNLVNAEEKLDAWVSVGRPAGLGIKRRSGLRAWEKKVRNFALFSECAKKKYVFAEAFLADIAPCLALPAAQSTADFELLKDLELNASYLYFKCPKDAKTDEPVKLALTSSPFHPCALDEPNIVSFLNYGGQSRGLSVCFIGPYVENEEITFSDVSILRHKNGRLNATPFALEKVELMDGGWAYYYHDPDFLIPPKVDKALPGKKQMQLREERNITVRFVPHGNPRKVLDIAVVLVPDAYPEGQAGWTVWQRWGSKKAFIAQYNAFEERFWAKHSMPDQCPLLREEDYD